MSTIITPSEEQINIVVNDEKISINVESGDVIVNVNEQIVEVSTVNGGYPLPTTVYSVFGRTGNIIATEGDYDLGELGDVTLVSTTNGDVLTYDGTKWVNKAVSGTGTVTSVDMSVPVGLQVSGNPISTVGTLAVNFAAGYSLPTTAKQTTWDTAYNDSIVSASVSGTTTKTLTLNQQDGGTITASWTDIDTNLVTSVNGYVGTVVLTTSDIAEGSRLYYTETRVSNNVDVAANTAARHSAVTIGTANGLSLASQVLSLALASASTTGALSSTDWATFNNKVPYSGATGNVTLGEYQLSAGQVAFDQSPTGTAGVGILRWNDSDGTLDLGLKGGNVTLQVGQEMVARVVNKTGADLLESGYKVVRISSAQGQRLAVQLAQANNDTNSTDTIGIVTETIVNNQEGFITILGQVKEINTTGSLQGETWADGDVLYLSPTTAGNITNIKPIAPSHMVVVGYVEYAHSQHGKIYCKTQNGYELEELHDCYLPTYVSNGVLYRDTTNNLWKNASIATVLGYTPISLASLSGVSPLSYNNTTGAFSIAQATTSANGYLSSTDWNTFNGKQAALSGTGFVKISGTTISYDNNTYYLASNPSAYIALTGLSATAPLSYNNTTGGFTISQAGVSSNGYLSSTDWNTFNNKQAAGDYITALSGEATASGPGSAAVTLSTSAVTGKILTGVNITGGSISATDSILVAFGKIQNQINGVLGGAIYQSTWNASTNNPALTSGTGTKGYYYIVSVAGSTNLDGITDWKIGDWAIFNGTTWNKVDNSDAVSSVNGFTGAVSLTTANISEVTNLYYTEGRVSANTDVAANTAARHAAVTLGTANGLSLSTQQLSLGLASTSATGALSSTDWNTFNLKQAALSGTGFVKISGSTISYDNSTYLTTSAAASTYLPLSGGTLTGPLGGTSISISGVGQFQGYTLSGDFGANYTIGLGVGMPGSSPAKGLNFGWNNVDDVAFIGAVQNGTAWKSINITPVGGSVGIGINPTYKLHVNGTLGVVDAATFSAAITATSFIKVSGTSSQFLKADGTVDSSTYLTTSSASSTYLPLAGGTLTGPLNGTKFAFSISSNSDWAGAIDNLGTTGANGLYVNIGASSTGTPFAVYKNFSQLFKVANDGAATFSSSVQADGSGNGFLINQNGGASGLATYSVNTDKAQIAFKYAQNYPASNNYTRVLDIVSTGDATGGGMIRLFTTVNNSTPSAALILSSTGAATFSSTLQVNGSQSYFGSTKGFIYFVEDQINCYYSSNAAATLAVNYYGYNQGLTQFRSFDVYNGKGVRIINIDGTTSTTNFYGAATFTSSVDASQFNGNVLVGSATVGGKVKFNYGANAVSRSYIIVSDAYNYGDLGFQQSTTQTGSTYANKMILAANGDLTLGSVPSTGTGTLYAAIGSFSGQVNGSSGAAFSGQVTAGGYTASGDFGAAYTINGAIGISGKGVNIGWNTTNDCGFIGTVHNGTAWKNLALVPLAGALLVGTAVAATGLLQVSGTVYATGFYESSDIRFKNILATNPNVNVSGIDVIKFTRKDKDIDQVRYGYSAQQVQSILSDVVTGNEFLNVNYLDVHTLKIAALEQEIKELKAKMN